MVKLGLFRSSRSKEQQEKSLKTTKRIPPRSRIYGREVSNQTTDTERTDDSVRSECAETTTLAQVQPPSLSPTGQTSTLKNAPKTKKSTRFASKKSLCTVHPTYSRLDNDIATNTSHVWWDMEELDRCRKADFQSLVTYQQRRDRCMPVEVQELCTVMGQVYDYRMTTRDDLDTNNDNDDGDDDDAWQDQLYSALDAASAWRGLEDFMGLEASTELRDAHVLGVLAQVKSSSNNNNSKAKTTRNYNKKRNHNKKKNTTSSSSSSSSVLAVTPTATSAVAARIAAARATHDARQVDQ